MIPHQANVRIIEATAKHAEHPDGQGLRERRPLRQHLGRVGADRARRGDRARAYQRGNDRAARGVRRRLHVGLDDRSLLAEWTSFCCFPDRDRRSQAWGRTSPTRFPPRATSSTAPTRRSACSLSQLCFEGPADELTLTHNAQPALLAHGAARVGRDARRHRRERHGGRWPLAGRVHGVPRGDVARPRGRGSPRSTPRRADVRERREAARAPWRRFSATRHRPIEEICEQATTRSRARRCRRTTTRPASS